MSDAIDQIREAQKVIAEVRSRHKKFVSNQTPIQAPIEAPSVVGCGKRKKVVEDVDAYIPEPTITLSFPSSVHAYDEPYLPQLEKLLFPKNRETFDDLGLELTGQIGITNAFKGLQSLLYMTEKAKVLTRENNELKSSKAALSAEVASLKGKMTEFEALKAERKALMESKEAYAKSLQFALSEVGALRNRIIKLEAEATASCYRAEVRVRSEMMRDYLAGKDYSWDAEKIFKDEDNVNQLTASDPV